MLKFLINHIISLKKVILLPIRGGAVFGHDVDRIACIIAEMRNERFYAYDLELHASGISSNPKVAKNVEERLKYLDQTSIMCAQ